MALENGDPSAEDQELGFLRQRLAEEAGGSPKYWTLRNALVDAVARGLWGPGARLPTEVALASALSLATGTVQKSYQMLVNEGIVVRRRGSGSFVASSPQEMPEPWHCRFLADDGKTFLPVYPEVIGRHPRIEAPQAQQHFHRCAALGCIERVIRIAQEFSVLSRFYASQDVIGPLLAISDEKLNGANFKTLLLREWNRPVVSIAQSVAQVVTDEEVSELIGSKPDEPVLEIEALACTLGNAPVYYQELFVPRTSRRLLIDGIYRA